MQAGLLKHFNFQSLYRVNAFLVHTLNLYFTICLKDKNQLKYSKCLTVQDIPSLFIWLLILFSAIMLKEFMEKNFRLLIKKTNQSAMEKNWFLRMFNVELFQLENIVCTILECKHKIIR